MPLNAGIDPALFNFARSQGAILRGARQALPPLRAFTKALAVMAGLSGEAFEGAEESSKSSRGKIQ